MAGYTYDKSFANVFNIIAFAAALGILSGMQEDLVCILGRRAQFWTKEAVCSRCNEGEGGGEEGKLRVMGFGARSGVSRRLAMFLIKLHNR
jgi:hypothetical protein